ncbi:MAG: signal recognition particle-docking protein FtsY [bacterium]|nr:signal recognition particle-docking protein FtsY [bacterium]
MWEATRRLALTPVDPWFAKMASGLNKTRQSLVGQVKSLFGSRSAIDEELWQDLEDVLLTADVGVGATDRILEELRQAVKEKKIKEPQLLTGELKAILGRILHAEKVEEGAEEIEVPNRGLKVEHGQLMVVLMVGVNGAGKTTTTAKIAAHYKNQGFKVLMAAADTFRAAAIDQLQVWADRIGVDLIRHSEGADPAAVVYDAVAAAKARGTELLLVDTAGRLHNKANLMEELRKIRRVAGRDLEGAPHEILLVLDATTGQNALEQARVFNKVTELTGLILCKLDGTSRGGIILAVAQELNIPVRYIGVGEGVDDLREFEPEQFLAALFQE